MEENYKQNWETLKDLVEKACGMNPGDARTLCDTMHGMRKAYCTISKLMTLIENGEAEGIVCTNGTFTKPVNILQIKN